MSTTAPVPISHDRTIGELVAERPARARVFERLGIDYCCRGNRSLAEVAATEGMDPEALAAEVSAIVDTDGTDVTGLEPVALADHIERTHHAYLHEELPLLVALATKVRDVHESRHPELTHVAALVAEIRDDLEPHLAKEEQVLFPAIRDWADGQEQFPFGTLDNPVRMMMLEHDRAGALLEELRSVTGGYAAPDDACTSYRLLYERLAELEADTHQHVHLENNVLFRAVATAP